MRLWIDDERPVPDEYSHAVENSEDAINILSYARKAGIGVELISFDHDLGFPWEDGHDLVDAGIPGDTSRRVLLWIIENDFWPAEIRIHTANPVGREWLQGMVDRYGPYSQ